MTILPADGTGAGVPHLRWPFRVASRRLAQVEQDGIENVEQSVYHYLACPRGTRPLNPDWGIEDPTFAPGFDSALVAREIEESEDGRAHVTIDATGPNRYGQMDVTVQVELAE